MNPVRHSREDFEMANEWMLMKKTAKRSFFQMAFRQRTLFLMLLPAVVCLVIFRYLPMFGIYMSFIQYKLSGSFWSNFFSSEFVGFRWFIILFTSKDFPLVLRNTIATSLLSLIISFPAPIFLALMISEARDGLYKKSIQTMSYLPYFISWVIVVNQFFALLSANGPVNALLVNLGLVEKPILFFQEGKYFWWIIAFSNTWKGMGYSSIMYLAAITAVPPEQYEAATIDGAGRTQRIWYVTLPTIIPTISMILILSISGLLNAGFDQQFLMMNAMTQDYADVISTYVYRYGLKNSMYSYASAAGLFQSAASLMLLLIANAITKKANGHSIF
jgi:putative aldouronate transport system permease protein